MLKDNVTYATMDPQEYIEQLTQSRSLTFPKQFHEPIVVRPYHPVRRFVARMLDYTLLSTLIFLIVFAVFRVRPATELLTNVISYGAPVLALPILAYLLSKFGTTPGKWLMGLEVYSIYGGKMHFDAAFGREIEVFTRGYGLGVPLISPILEVINYRKYGNQDPDWDRYCEYIYHPWTKKRKIAFILAVTLIISALFVGYLDLLKPKYRGDLTIAEFTVNHNAYLDGKEGFPSDRYLNADGTWCPPKENGGQGVIVIGYDTEIDPIAFTLEGESLTALHYRQTWTDISTFVNPSAGLMKMLVLNAVMSRPGTGYTEYVALLNELAEKASDPTGMINVANVHIQWTIKTENCSAVNKGSYLRDNPEKDSWMELNLEIKLQ